jgi:hypothetical protein
MKIKSTTQEKDFSKPCIPEDFYTGTLKEVKPVKEGEYGPRIAFIYSVDGQDEEIELAVVCYTKNPANKDNKLGQIIMAHGVELNDDEIELDALVGTKAKLLVENYKDNDGKECSGIGKVKPLE